MSKKHRRRSYSDLPRQPVKVVHVRGGLSFQEQAVLHHLQAAAHSFAVLPGQTKQDVRDFDTFIHALERHVMARLAQRAIAQVDAA